MKKIALGIAILSAIVFTSCTSDDDSPTPKAEIKAPATYVFDRNGNSSVSFSGQTARIKMANELGSALKDNSKTKIQLDAMFADGTGFEDADLNTSGKKIRNKTAASKDFFGANTTDAAAIKEQFDGWIALQVSEVFENWTNEASKGNAGFLQEAGGGSTRYINSKGLEYNQAFAKSLIGALMADQILNNYLSPAVLDAGDNKKDNDATTLKEGKDYTLMEHKWDEAYGYLYGNEDNPAVPVLGADSYLNKYLGKVESDTDFTGIATDIYNAFKLGRAAIVGKDYVLRNKQADIIREKISTAIAIRAVFYLQAGKSNLGTDNAGAFHDLSEGYGFIFSLQFTRKPGTTEPYFTKQEVDRFLDQLMVEGGFWDLTPETLDTISEAIAAKFDFTVEQAK
ncbi:MAG TPA: DUF4856 domain-containing protein [Flavobacteriaceae bacterium]|nr:DUF4856 domain-containing protein [Flavobacteriaceae bacterium]